MKKIFTFFKATTLLLALLFSIDSAAQKISCSMLDVNFIRPFDYLVGGKSLSAVEVDNGTDVIDIGFTFRMGGTGAKTNHTKLQISSNGWAKLLSSGTASSGSIPDGGSTAAGSNNKCFGVLWSDLSGVGGTATYLTELLSSGTKVFTMEWKNWKWNATATAPCVTFQLKLYEGSDIIEYCYKRESLSSITGTTTAAVIVMDGPRPPGIATCYDIINFSNVDAVPLVNRAGAFGPNITTLPPDNQVYQFYTECNGKPEAGFISQPDSVCFCTPFVAKLSGATPSPFASYGIEYQWQSSPDGTPTSWVNVPGATSPSQSFLGICGGVDTFLRVIVTCTKSGMKDTTDAKQIKLITLPYNCYCYSSATIDDNLNGVNIGNVKVITKGKDTLLDNVKGGGTPGFLNKKPFRPYSLYTGLTPTELNRDTTYQFSVMGLTRDTFAFAGSGVALYIDYNNDGLYNTSSELASFKVISGTAASFTNNFTVPSTAVMNELYGMRVVMKKGGVTAADVPPCGTYSEGETEDYLVKIVNPKCPGPLSAGTAYISDTSICYGYKTLIWDTAHAKNMSGMHWEWEYSLDNVNWANVVGSKFQDTIQPVVRQSTYYRLREVCEITEDTIYSNTKYIKLKLPYKCYCYGLAGQNGPAMDSSDISTVKIHTFTANSGGPHLNNPESVRARTDYTDLPAIELWSETRYPIAVFHTLRTKNHSDAKISVFMDFNHNLKYDGASELIWTHVTSYTDFYPHDSITIPRTVIPNVETGMRVVLNNDLSNGNPNDIGCDDFVSGEIEDFLVIFRRPGTGIGDVTNVDNLQIYPNPNNGQFTVSFTANATISNATISVTNITGQQIYSEQYTNVTNSFIKNVNLGNQAAGVYFITVIADGQKSINKLIIR